MEISSAKELNEKGVSASKQGKYGIAIDIFKKCIEEYPEYDLARYNLAVAYNNLAKTFKEKKELKAAISLLKKSILIYPEYAMAYSNIVYLLLHLCDWQAVEQMGNYLDNFTKAAIRKGEKTPSSPFLDILRKDNPEHNYLVAKSWSDDIKSNLKDKHIAKFKYDWENKQIRIGYVSDGFRDFPTAHNLLDVILNHNRRKFDIYTYSYGDDDGSFWSGEYKKHTNFVDLEGWRLSKAVSKINEDNIDILVDLKGHTDGGNLEMFARKPAKVNVSWLGFPGTTGADFIDYAIVDKTVVPEEEAAYWSEKLLYMPDCYRPVDTATPVDNIASTNSSTNNKPPLVYSSFNNLYKIDSKMWQVWMNILKSVPKSVLWLWEKDPYAVKNLMDEAVKQGVRSDRIIFKKRLEKAEHLQRISRANIALDTRIVNGHTTTAETLRMGVPVVTLAGGHFCSRVSASCLKACGMDQLITHSLHDYEQLAIKLGNSKSELSKTKQKLADNLKTYPLLDHAKFTRNLEKLYLIAYRGYEK